MVAELSYPLIPLVRARYEEQLRRNKHAIEYMRNDVYNPNNPNIYALQADNMNLQAVLTADDRARSMDEIDNIDPDAYTYPLSEDKRTELETMYRSNINILHELDRDVSARYRPVTDESIEKKSGFKNQNKNIIAVLKRDQLHKLEEVA